MEKEIDILKYPEHTKLAKLTICSNILIGGGDLIKIENFVPLVIGAGILPKIWIIIKSENKLIEIIKENSTNNNQIRIDTDLKLREVKIFAGYLHLITAKMVKNGECIVNHLDLRPIGLNIFGNSTELNIATNKFSKNSLQGSKFLISMN